MNWGQVTCIVHVSIDPWKTAEQEKSKWSWWWNYNGTDRILSPSLSLHLGHRCWARVLHYWGHVWRHSCAYDSVKHSVSFCINLYTAELVPIWCEIPNTVSIIVIRLKYYQYCMKHQTLLYDWNTPDMILNTKHCINHCYMAEILPK